MGSRCSPSRFTVLLHHNFISLCFRTLFNCPDLRFHYTTSRSVSVCWREIKAATGGTASGPEQVFGAYARQGAYAPVQRGQLVPRPEPDRGRRWRILVGRVAPGVDLTLFLGPLL